MERTKRGGRPMGRGPLGLVMGPALGLGLSGLRLATPGLGRTGRAPMKLMSPVLMKLLAGRRTRVMNKTVQTMGGMRRFAVLAVKLGTSTKTNDKLEALVN